LGALIEHCRGLRYMLEAGLTLGQAMKQQAKKGPLSVRPVAGRMGQRLSKGEDFRTVLREERDRFPPLFLALGSVAEETGNLPEVLRDLEEYFETQRQMWKKFWSMIAWPMFQLFAAVGVLTLLILLLGWIESVRGPSSISVFGLKGTSGAAIFLGSFCGLFTLTIGGYLFIRNVLQRGAFIDRILLAVPLLGGTMRNFALSRFSMGLALAMEAGVPIREAARLSLEATGNHAFTAEIDKVESYIQAGHSLTEALRETGMFPQAYLMSVETAELGGREPDVMQRQAKNLHEDGVRGLKRLTGIAGAFVWLLVAAFIIFFIFSIALQISGIYSEAMKGI
jgi:type II secretory pathway component PulF